MNFEQVYLKFLNRLETISQAHDELTDTDVRERLHAVINFYFIWGNPIDKSFPHGYSMFSDEADALVYKAVLAFIVEAQLVGTAIGQSRNDLIENSTIKTHAGNEYDWFLGSIDTVLPAQRPMND